MKIAFFGESNQEWLSFYA